MRTFRRERFSKIDQALRLAMEDEDHLVNGAWGHRTPLVPADSARLLRTRTKGQKALRILNKFWPARDWENGYRKPFFDQRSMRDETRLHVMLFSIEAGDEDLEYFLASFGPTCEHQHDCCGCWSLSSSQVTRNSQEIVVIQRFSQNI